VKVARVTAKLLGRSPASFLVTPKALYEFSTSAAWLANVGDVIAVNGTAMLILSVEEEERGIFKIKARESDDPCP